jgi:inner membrane protein COX18
MSLFRQNALRPQLFVHQATQKFSSKPVSSLLRDRLLCTDERLFGRRRFSFVSLADNAVQGSVQAISQLHMVTGTPWYLTIPLVALLLNVFGRLPLTIYSRLIQQRQGQLSSVLQAWLVKLTLQQASRQTSSGQESREVSRRYRTVERRIFRELGVQKWKAFSQFLVFPFWLAVIEAIKRLAGETRGLLSSLVFGARARHAETEIAAASGNPAIAAGEASLPTAGVSTDFEVLPNVASGADMTLSTGGCLWFPDLMVPDPLHILPILLSVSLVANLIPSTAEGRRRILDFRTDNSPAKVQTRLLRAMLPIAALIGPYTMGLPSALHLFWLSTSLITFSITRVVHRLMPVDSKKTKPCQGMTPRVIPAQFLGK